MDYEYVIIGGGPSGIFCADKLSQLGYKVCLIDFMVVYCLTTVTLVTKYYCHAIPYPPCPLVCSCKYSGFFNPCRMQRCYFVQL